MNFSEFDTEILHIIQRTPCIETLATTLRRRGFPSINEKTPGTRFQKCRRLFDNLLQECFQYDDEKKDQLKKIFSDTGNGSVGELLYSLQIPDKPLFLQPSPDNFPLRCADIRISTCTIMQIFRAAKAGNAIKLDNLLKGVALACSGCSDPNPRAATLKSVDLSKYREALGAVLLNKRDWMDKTLLHIVTDGKSVACVDVVLRYCQEAHRKSDLLDAKDAFGQTALHIAIRLGLVQVTKKLILEGSDLNIPNYAGQTSLELIYSWRRLSGVATFVLDRAVTISGENSGETLLFNIDFGMLALELDVTTPVAESRLKNPFQRSRGFHKGESRHNRPCPIPAAKEDVSPTHRQIMNDHDDDVYLELSMPFSSTQEDMMKGGTLRRTQFRKKYSQPITAVENPDVFREMSVLAQINAFGNSNKFSSEILAHPVVQTYLDIKWDRMKFYLLATYGGFRVFIYGLYMILMYQIYFYHCPLQRSPRDNTYPAQCESPLWIQIALPVVLLCNSIFFVQSLCKAVRFVKVHGLISSLCLSHKGFNVVIRTFGLTILTGNCLLPYVEGTLQWQHYLLAVAGILTSAVLILEIIGNSNCNFIVHSIYIHVYRKVIARFLTVLITFSPLVISFTLAFNILYPEVPQFNGFFRSLFRILIMLQGEFDYEDKVYTRNMEHSVEVEIQENRNSSETDMKFLGLNVEPQMPFWAGQILFALLSCVLTLVLIDVFLGYTVSDITELKRQAEYVRRCNQIEQMEEAERFLCWTRGIFCKTKTPKFFDYFNVIPTSRRKHYRNDIFVSLEEMDESVQVQFRQIVIEQ